MVLMELLVVSFKSNLFFVFPWQVGMVVFLERLLTLSNVYVYEEDKIFETIESGIHRGNAGDPFNIKRLYSRINIADKFLAQIKL